MSSIDSLLGQAQAAVEAGLADHPDRDMRLHRLHRRVASLDEPEQRAVVFLREASEAGEGPSEELIVAFGADVATACGLLAMQEEETYADVVMRSAQHPLAREVLANDIGEELDRLARARSQGADPGARWDLLIMSQALLDRVSSGDEDAADPEPVRIETENHTANLYVHPVHGDIVVLVEPPVGSEEQEQWLLIDKQHRNEMLLELLAERLSEPLESGLVPWLEARNIRHHVYGSDEMGDGGTALA